MIDNINGPSGAPPFSSKGGANETTPKGLSPQANVEGLSRQQEPDESRVAAVEIAKQVENNVSREFDAGSLLSIQRNEEVQRYVYRGLNPETREVERQWPTEEALRQMTVFREMMGRVLDESS
jgi:uncharacterized FlaG/YvyC family protein